MKSGKISKPLRIESDNVRKSVRLLVEGGISFDALKEAVTDYNKEELTKPKAQRGRIVSDNKLISWFKDFGGQGERPPTLQEARTTVRGEKAAQPKPSSKKLPRTPPTPPTKARRRVFDVGDPNVHGSVMTAGGQVSVVRWDTPSPWGKESNVSNESLRDVESEPSKMDLSIFRNAVTFKVVLPNGKVKKNLKGGGTHREDEIVSEHKHFKDAVDHARDKGLWIFAMTKGGSIALLLRLHWGLLLNLERGGIQEDQENVFFTKSLSMGRG